MAVAEMRPQRRVAGYHDIRMDGMQDVVARARGAKVLDVGCNRSLAGLEFACNGASEVHGVDIYAPGIEAAKHMFADIRSVQSKFVVADLTRGPVALQEAFSDKKYDIVLCLATLHKLRRTMDGQMLYSLLEDLGRRTRQMFCWRGTSDKDSENLDEFNMLNEVFGCTSLRLVHWSMLSEELGRCAVWRRKPA